MPFTTLISTAELAEHLADPDWAVVDVRFSLTDHAVGERSYLAAHIAGAVYAHLERDLVEPADRRHDRPPPAAAPGGDYADVVAVGDRQRHAGSRV